MGLTKTLILLDQQFIELSITKSPKEFFKKDKVDPMMIEAVASNDKLDTHEAIKIMKMLLDCGANINAADEYGHTALYYAIKNYAIENEDKGLVEFLLSQGADINATHHHSDYFTVLILAVDYQRLNFVKFLLDHGANIDIVDKLGRTALSIAQKNKNQKLEEDRRIAGEIEKLILDHKSKQDAAK